MTENERILLALALGQTGERKISNAFLEARAVVARERIEASMPGWEEQFRTLLHAHIAAERKYDQLCTEVKQALTHAEFAALVEKHYPKDPK